MTPYTLIWVRSAVSELARIWMDAENRGEITSATNAIDEHLRQDAELKGVEISEGLRSPNYPPLRVMFEVRIDDRIVEVVQVRQM